MMNLAVWQGKESSVSSKIRQIKSLAIYTYLIFWLKTYCFTSVELKEIANSCL